MLSTISYKNINKLETNGAQTGKEISVFLKLRKVRFPEGIILIWDGEEDLRGFFSRRMAFSFNKECQENPMYIFEEEGRKRNQ